jgi:hypothetical protein
MKGEINIGLAINLLLKISRPYYFPNESDLEFNLDAFKILGSSKELNLF